MQPNKLKQILDDHGKWLRGEGGKRATLAGATLKRANLADADLTSADLAYANLVDANLKRANLTNATLKRADLTYADLTDANLTRTIMTNAILTNANGIISAGAPDGWTTVAYHYDSEVMVLCGCRTKTLAEAEFYWSPTHREWSNRQEIAAALRYIREVAVLKGWIDEERQEVA